MLVLVLIVAVIFFMPTLPIKTNLDQQSDIDNTKSHSASESDVVNLTKSSKTPQVTCFVYFQLQVSTQ